MRVILANGLGNAPLAACLEALLTAEPDWEPDVHVIRERGTREATWNAGLEEAGRDEDVLFLGDDVRLTPGFREALERGAREAEIVGLCTLDPGGERVQDRGYRLARVDGRVTVDALDRGRRRDELEPFGVRPCDAVCGCLFLVKSAVLRAVERFRPEGMNRWGELIYALEARRIGARIAVAEHYVEHAGEGTKGHADPLLSSTSWSSERQLWSRLVDRFVRPEWISSDRRTRVDSALLHWLERAPRVVLYGAGTVAEVLLSQDALPPRSSVLCSGLPEEAGSPFCGHVIHAVEDVSFRPGDHILVTPLHRGEKIARQVIQPRLPAGFDGEVAAVTRSWGAEGEEHLTLERLDLESGGS